MDYVSPPNWNLRKHLYRHIKDDTEARPEEFIGAYRWRYNGHTGIGKIAMPSECSLDALTNYWNCGPWSYEPLYTLPAYA